MLTEIIFNLIGIFIFLFLFWKKLKEDYFPSLIFSCAFYMIIGILLGFVVSSIFVREAWFWLSFLGLALGFLIGVLRLRLRAYETIEAGTISLLPWAALIFLADAATTSSVTSFLFGIFCAALIVFYIFLDRHYKNFSWYASGRVGFSGLATLGTFFLLRAFLAIFTPSVLSFVSAETLISGIIATVSFLAVYRLAREKV